MAFVPQWDSFSCHSSFEANLELVCEPDRGVAIVVERNIWFFFGGVSWGELGKMVYIKRVLLSINSVGLIACLE
jgi:hypothetical protein